ncbi:MAG: S8 family serine peptidase [Polyangiaceae bacterium]|nr:S8 family serine peptidase [Polyangiaceae bacterium]
MPTMFRAYVSTPRIVLGLLVAASQTGWVCTPTPDHFYVQVARFERHLPGLGETVAYVTEVDAAGRRGPRQLAVRGNGLRQSIERVGELEEQARVRRWGAMTPELVAALDRLRPGEEVEVAFLAVSDLDWARASPDLVSGDVEARTAAYRESRLRVGASARRLADRISVRGLRHVRPLLAMPMATAIVSDPRALVRLARDPSVAAVFLAPRATQLLSAPLGTYPEAGRFPKGHTDVGSHCLNDAGHFGAEQRIGIIEGRGTGFYLRHDAFAVTQPSRVHYQHEPYSCSTDFFDPATVGASSRWFKSTHCQQAGSAGLWDPLDTDAFSAASLAQVCIADQVLHSSPVCVLSHNESVLSSMISSGRDAYPDGQAVRPHGPVRASIYYANQGDVWETGAGESVPPNPDGSPGSVGENWRNVRSVGCDLKSTDAAVDWLAANGVRILSESYFCEGAGQEVDGMVQDQFARQNAILTFRAAGNTGKKVVCPSRNGVCVGNHRMGASELAFDSSWQNLDGSDREKPDVTAMGTLVDAIDLAGTFRPGYRGLDTPFSYRPRTCVEVHDQKGACDGDNLLVCLPGDDVPRQVMCDSGICGWDATADAGTGANRCAAGGAFMDPTRAVPRFAVPDDEHAFGYFRQVSGTSFATPLLAGAAALVSEHCGELSPLELRAILRASGYARNPDGSTHSGKILTTEGMQTEDGRDGAGAPSTVAAAAFCDGEPIPGNFPPTSTYGSGELDPSAAPPLPAALADGVGALLWQGQLRENDRVRAELVWHACPASAPGESAKATNFNLALCRGSTCVAHALSIDDNNEGFDAGIEQTGDYQLYWWSPVGTKPCFGKPEPAAWALAHGPRSQFAFGGVCP